MRCPIIGIYKPWNCNVLPTNQDVLQYYLFTQTNAELIRSKIITAKVTDDIQTIWNKTTIPIVTPLRIKQIVHKLHDSYIKVKKNYFRDKFKTHYIEKLSAFKRSLLVLCDIAICKCDFNFCSCSKIFKIPAIEKKFIIDQRTERKMLLVVTNIPTHKTEVGNVVKVNSNYKRSISSLSISRKRRSPIKEPVSITKTILKNKKNTILVPTLAKVCDRYGLSDAAGAATANSIMQDLGLISTDKPQLVIDRCKLKRAREKSRLELQQQTKHIDLYSVYFDGRKDSSLCMINKGTGKHIAKVKEEHLSIVKEPGSQYLGHTVPKSSSAKDVASSILDYLGESCQSSMFKIVGCDGTVVNTGQKGGVICCLERSLEKPLQRFICLLHANELPLRHLITHLDGTTSGPKAFSGLIGSALPNCHNLPVVPFAAITAEPYFVNQRELSSDQQYLLDICLAVTNGNCSAKLANRSPGALNHSRWLTTANRVLRLYVATIKPSENLKTIATFILKVYAKIWFAIKARPSCTEAASHLCSMIQASRYLPDSLRKVVDNVIQRNAYYAHPENILLGMVFDENEDIRQLAIKRILHARLKSNYLQPRKYVVPPLRFDAKRYYDLIDWQNTTYTEPPIFSEFSKIDLEYIINPTYSPKGSKMTGETIKSFPCHTQGVERTVKVVTESSKKVCGFIRRDGVIRNQLLSREEMPTFHTKKDWNLSK